MHNLSRSSAWLVLAVLGCQQAPPQASAPESAATPPAPAASSAPPEAAPTPALPEATVSSAPPPAPPSSAAPKFETRVRLGAIMSSSTDDTSELRAAFEGHLEGVGECYEAALAKNEALEGRISFKLSSATDGTSVLHDVDTDIKDDALIRCATAAVLKIPLPKSIPPKAAIVIPMVLAKL